MDEGNFGQFGVGNTGDVGRSVQNFPPIVNATTTKKSRKWPVILAVGMVFVLVAVMVFAVWRGGTGGGSKDLKEFYKLANYVMSGENDEEQNDETVLADSYKKAVEKYEENPYSEMLYAIAIREQIPAEIEEYYVVLDEKMQEFFGQNVASKIISEYRDSLKIMENAINYRAIREKMIDVYEEKGEEEARKYLEEEVACADDGLLIAVCRVEKEYYGLYLTEYINGNLESTEIYNYLQKITGEVALSLINSAVREEQALVLEEMQNAN